jgi:hypothetical protein
MSAGFEAKLADDFIGRGFGSFEKRPKYLSLATLALDLESFQRSFIGTLPKGATRTGGSGRTPFVGLSTGSAGATGTHTSLRTKPKQRYVVLKAFNFQT